MSIEVHVADGPPAHYTIYGVLAQTLVNTGAHTVTKYLSPTHTVRATRKVRGGRIDRRSNSIDIVFTDGRPNYHAREFIKRCKKAGEPFPAKKIQITYFPKRKRK